MHIILINNYVPVNLAMPANSSSSFSFIRSKAPSLLSVLKYSANFDSKGDRIHIFERSQEQKIQFQPFLLLTLAFLHL